MTEIVAKSVTVRRGSRVILDNISISATKREFIALIGANGAGKSTLLSVLAGLLVPDSGAVEIDNVPIANVSAAKLARFRAYLPQNPRCEWPISVARLVALGLTPNLPALGGMPGSFLPAIDRALAQCDLLHRRDQPATTLSGGELERAMLARALVGNPDILIVDEPISGLDPRHALDTMRRLQGLAYNGKLVVAAIHDLTLAARYASRIIALAGGKVRGDGEVAATLTTRLVSEVFDINACISGGPGALFVDFLDPDRRGNATLHNVEATLALHLEEESHDAD